MNIHQRRTIQQFIAVLAVAAIAVIAFATYILYKYIPSGSYIAGHTLLSPEMALEIHYSDSVKDKGRYLVFGGIEFSYIDPKTLQAKRIPVVLSSYDLFYHEIEREPSISSTPQIEKFFDSRSTSTLSILVHDPSSHEEPQVFQIIQFAPHSDYYRIQLLDKNARNQWAYYTHPKIDQEALRLFHESE